MPEIGVALTDISWHQLGGRGDGEVTALFCPRRPSVPLLQFPVMRGTGQSPLHVDKSCWTPAVQISWGGGIPDMCSPHFPEAKPNTLQAFGMRLGKGVVSGPRTQQADSLAI